MEWNRTIRLPRRTLGISLKIGLKKREGTTVLGITNKVGHFYVPFLDYDINEPLFVEKEIKSLQAEYLLGDAFLFRTGKGFHVIFLDLIQGELWREILSASNCDEEYKNVPQTNKAKAWVLRTTNKKNNSVIFYKTIQGYIGNNLSRPHYNYLLQRGVPEQDLQRLRIYTTKADEQLIWASYEA